MLNYYIILLNGEQIFEADFFYVFNSLLTLVSSNTVQVFMEHEHSGDFWTDFVSIATDPAHLLFEALFTIGFDGIVVALFWGVLIKKLILPKLRKDIHTEIDQEHGISHDGSDSKVE